VIDADKPSDKEQSPIIDRFPLATLFPLEFADFKQSGSMDFRLSFYLINGGRTGVQRQRIERVGLQIFGAIDPATKMRVIHHGSFLLRDDATTPEPDAGRFIPDPQRLKEALEALKAGGPQGESIDGVMPFILDEDTIELSLDTPFPEADPAKPALRPIEGYGPAGDWRIEVDAPDLRGISSIDLLIEVSFPESKSDLARRVEGLLAKFETEIYGDEVSEEEEALLDRVTPFSLRNDFPNVFQQLPGGQVLFPMDRQDFPTGIIDLKLKTIVAQALDKEKNPVEGFAIELSRPGTQFLRVRTTGPDGFSEDLADVFVLPKEQRFPIEGEYQIRLTDPAQLGLIDDILLFFMFSFRRP